MKIYQIKKVKYSNKKIFWFLCYTEERLTTNFKLNSFTDECSFSKKNLIGFRIT